MKLESIGRNKNILKNGNYVGKSTLFPLFISLKDSC